MNKVLISAALAVAVIANGSAFADANIDYSLYEESQSFAGKTATVAMPVAGPLSAKSASLYEEVTFGAVADVRPVNLDEQLADRGLRQVHGWISTFQDAQTRFAQPE